MWRLTDSRKARWRKSAMILGASDINAARNAMLGTEGLEGAAQAVADAGFLVAFDDISDPKFAPVDHP